MEGFTPSPVNPATIGTAAPVGESRTFVVVVAAAAAAVADVDAAAVIVVVAVTFALGLGDHDCMGGMKKVVYLVLERLSCGMPAQASPPAHLRVCVPSVCVHRQGGNVFCFLK